MMFMNNESFGNQIIPAKWSFRGYTVFMSVHPSVLLSIRNILVFHLYLKKSEMEIHQILHIQAFNLLIRCTFVMKIKYFLV